ncbi:MAG: hypothetical protein ACTSUE_15180, partial [Promethearchaeota archaeon]
MSNHTPNKKHKRRDKSSRSSSLISSHKKSKKKSKKEKQPVPSLRRSKRSSYTNGGISKPLTMQVIKFTIGEIIAKKHERFENMTVVLHKLDPTSTETHFDDHERYMEHSTKENSKYTIKVDKNKNFVYADAISSYKSRPMVYLFLVKEWDLLDSYDKDLVTKLCEFENCDKMAVVVSHHSIPKNAKKTFKKMGVEVGYIPYEEVETLARSNMDSVDEFDQELLEKERQENLSQRRDQTKEDIEKYGKISGKSRNLTKLDIKHLKEQEELDRIDRKRAERRKRKGITSMYYVPDEDDLEGYNSLTEDDDVSEVYGVNSGFEDDYTDSEEHHEESTSSSPKRKKRKKNKDTEKKKKKNKKEKKSKKKKREKSVLDTIHLNDTIEEISDSSFTSDEENDPNNKDDELADDSGAFTQISLKEYRKK